MESEHDFPPWPPHILDHRMMAGGVVMAAWADDKTPKRTVPPSAQREVDFVRDIQPIFTQRCHECHGPNKVKGGLRLDRKADALAGGDSGPVLVAGKSADSILIRLVAGADPHKVMPPKKGERLSAEQIGLLRTWIDRGLSWPEAGAAKSESKLAGDHWAFQKLRRPEPPAIRRPDWVRTPIDRFILARLEKESIAPAAEADRATLLRRLHLDLIGLLPTPEEVDRALSDRSGSWYPKVVESLLASPHFGERWGRHWLDLARYADSDGYENDKPRNNAFVYRDWVIQAINRDLPYDQFTIEQLAGDLLPNATPEQKVAAGFHRNTLHNSAGGADKEEFRIKAVKDRTNTTGTVWLGLTLGCCQCHTHKYDPIRHKEYYELFAFFNDANDASVKVPGGDAATVVYKPRASHIHVRGDFLRPGERVQPGTPEFLPPLRPRGKAPDRLDLARWIVAPENPLTARVAVNQIWRHLFGQPLVATPDNLGTHGDRPTHPELLDWLACEFVERGWSRKQMIRLIVTSAAYRQSSHHRPELRERDPANTLLARQIRFRVEAEIVRDLALDAASLLDRRLGGQRVQPPLPTSLARSRELKGETFMESSSGQERYRRGVYVNVQRTFPYPTLLTFDAPDGNESCPCRDRSNTPMQALTLLNDPVFFECAQALGRKVIGTGRDDGIRLRQAWERCLGRSATATELAVLQELLVHHREHFTRQAKAAEEMAGKAPLPDGMSRTEVAAWVGVARTLLNLEEFLTRP